MDSLADPNGPSVLRESHKKQLFDTFVAAYEAAFDEMEPVETLYADILADMLHHFSQALANTDPIEDISLGGAVDWIVNNAVCHFRAETRFALGD